MSTDPKKLELVIVGGPNGSGKSTFARSYIQLHPMDYLCADDIAREINPEDMSSAKVSAGREFFKKLDKYRQEKQSLMIESTLSGVYLNKLIAGFKKDGYEIILVFVFLYSPKVSDRDITSTLKVLCRTSVATRAQIQIRKESSQEYILV